MASGAVGRPSGGPGRSRPVRWKRRREERAAEWAKAGKGGKEKGRACAGLDEE